MTELKVLVVLDAKLSFESHLRLFACLVIRSWFQCVFMLSMLEYCFLVCISVKASRLCILCRVVSKDVILVMVVSDLDQILRFPALCTFHKILGNPDHVLQAVFICYGSCMFDRLPRHVVSVHFKLKRLQCLT